MSVLRPVLTIFVLLYYLNIILCRRKFPPWPVHNYKTKNLSECNVTLDCRKWETCYYNLCVPIFNQKCWKHWHCRGYLRCVDHVCMDPPRPIRTELRPITDMSYCNCPPDNICLKYKCHKNCNNSGFCPFNQICNHLGVCA